MARPTLPRPVHDPVLSAGRWEAPLSRCCDDLFSGGGGRNIRAIRGRCWKRQVVAGALQMRRLVNASLVALAIAAGPALAQPTGPAATPAPAPAPTPATPPPVTTNPPTTTANPPVVVATPPETPPPDTPPANQPAPQPAAPA